MKGTERLRDLSVEALEARRPQRTSSMREQARLEGVVGETISSKAGAANKIAEIKVQQIAVVEEDRAQYLSDMRDSEGKIAEFAERNLLLISTTFSLEFYY